MTQITLLLSTASSKIDFLKTPDMVFAWGIQMIYLLILLSAVFQVSPIAAASDCVRLSVADLSPDFEKIVGTTLEENESRVRVWNIDGTEQWRFQAAEEFSIRNVSFQDHGKTAIITLNRGYFTGFLGLESSTGKERFALKCQGPKSATIHANGFYLAASCFYGTSSSKGTLAVYDLRTKKLASRPNQRPRNDTVIAFGSNPADLYVTGARFGYLSDFEKDPYGTPQVLFATNVLNDDIVEAKVSPDSKLIATAYSSLYSRRISIGVRDLATHQSLGGLDSGRNSTSFHFSDDGAWLASKSDDGIALMNLRDFKERLIPIPQGTLGVRFSKDSSQIAAVSASGSVSVFELSSGKVLKQSGCIRLKP